MNTNNERESLTKDTISKIVQLATVCRNLKVQISQIANSINNRSHGDLTSKIVVNLREHYKAIILHSGRQLGEVYIDVEKEKNENEVKKKCQMKRVRWL